jgi:hypothetical protein
MGYERYHLVNELRGGSPGAVACFTVIASFYT